MAGATVSSFILFYPSSLDFIPVKCCPLVVHFHFDSDPAFQPCQSQNWPIQTKANYGVFTKKVDFELSQNPGP